MKLLFDENLSYRLPGLLADIYPLSVHVRDIGLTGAADNAIWRYAAGGGYIITSKDADFYQRSVSHGPPPKVIWLRIGNASTRTIAVFLRERHSVIRRFLEDRDASFLTLTPA